MKITSYYRALLPLALLFVLLHGSSAAAEEGEVLTQRGSSLVAWTILEMAGTEMSLPIG